MNNRIYSKKILKNNNACAEYSKQAQDNYSSFIVLLNADKVSLVSNAYYHYYQRENSAVHSFSKTYINNYFNVLVHIQNELIRTKQFKTNNYFTIEHRQFNHLYIFYSISCQY